MTEAVGLRIDPHDFVRVMREAKDFDRKLATSLRRNLRLAAAPIVDDVRKTLLQSTPKGSGLPPRRASVRQALADGTKLSISTSERNPGIRIRTSAAKLPPDKKVMLRLYNKETWQHPVFGEGELRATRKRAKTAMGALLAAGDAAHNKRVGKKWVTQHGRPYFGSVIGKHYTDAAKAARQALDEALEVMK